MAKIGKKTDSMIKSIQANISSLYTNTYFTQDNNRKDLSNIKIDIDKSIDSILNNNVTNSGVPNVSQLYSRLQMNNKGENGVSPLGEEMEDIFNDKAMTDAMISNFTENKYIKDYDEEIDVICKHMPTLEDALDAKKDNVLSADHFTKDYLNVINSSNVEETTTFNDRMKELKDRYKLLELTEEMYDNTTRYGEQFVYVVSYKKALNRMLNARNNPANTYVANEAVQELDENCVIFETVTYKDMVNFIQESTDSNLSSPVTEQEEPEFGDINISLNTMGVIESVVKEHKNIERILTESSSKFKSTVSSDIGFEGLENKSNQGVEGLVDTNKIVKKDSVDVPGSIVKKLKRHNVIPIYIDDLCLGYYYLEFSQDDVFTSDMMNDPMMSLRSGRLKMAAGTEKKDLLLQQMSAKLSKVIDSKFINANQDLRKEIYMVLKHNDTFNNKQASDLRVTFIPPEDMIHMTFKKDQDTHRGISDLERALLPAKLYISLYMNGYMGVVTRGHDKRVYYVKQTIDTNISKVLLNTINQIKKGNFGQREMTSVKNLLNITGRYNDFIVPVGSSGDSPINFEVMPGQQIDIKTELLELLEQMAINSTDVPYEYIQSRKNVDYAVRLTMSNGKFLRKSFKRQAVSEIFFGELCTKLYNNEFDESDVLRVELPPPAFLNLLNTNNMTQNINENVANILEMEMADEQDETLKACFARKLKRHYLSGFLDLRNIQTLKEQATMEHAIKKKKEQDM